jgi:hypothetical protein
MGSVRVWWQKLTGREPAKPQPIAKPAAAPRPPKAAGLELADTPEEGRASKIGAAGFDPYSSDAGFAKPHSWERVDHD